MEQRGGSPFFEVAAGGGHIAAALGGESGKMKMAASIGGEHGLLVELRGILPPATRQFRFQKARAGEEVRRTLLRKPPKLAQRAPSPSRFRCRRA